MGAFDYSRTTFQIHTSGRLLINKEALLMKKIFTNVSYRTQKSRNRLEEFESDGARWVYINSLTDVSREKVKNTFKKISGEYSNLLQAMDASGMDCVPNAIEFTADTLQINEPFIRSAVEIYMNSHYTAYTWAYLDAGLHSDSVKGYSKQCALVQWITDFANKIQTSEADTKRCEVLMRSFRMNLLTVICNIELEVKIPLSETRFNKWFDDVLKQMSSGLEPVDIIQIKRRNNTNAGKVTPEQQKIAEVFHLNGTNMSIAQVYAKWIEFGKRSGWWLDENGKYNPPTEGRLYQLLRPLKNVHLLGKTDAIILHLDTVPIYKQKYVELDETSVRKAVGAMPSFGIYRDMFFVTGIPLHTKINSNTADAMFQLSIRQRLTKSHFPFNSFLYLTYTQKSFWDIYSESSPFRDTNYNPGIGFGRYLVHNNKLKGAGFIQIEHESNGRDYPSFHPSSFSLLGF